MSISAATIDRIVANVLSELESATPPSSQANDDATKAVGKPVSLDEAVVTAELLGDVPKGSTLTVGGKAIITPAAWDEARERGITIHRDSRSSAKGTTNVSKAGSVPGSSLLIIVRHTDALDRLWEDLKSDWKRELLGCPDDAAALAISAVCRGEVKQAVILASETHRAACLANRHESVKAAAVSNPGEVRAVRKQLKANVWCLDPTERTYFELRNLFKAI